MTGVTEVEVREAARALLPEIDLETSSLRSVLQQLSTRVGADVSAFKPAVSQEVDRFLLATLGGEDGEYEAAGVKSEGEGRAEGGVAFEEKPVVKAEPASAAGVRNETRPTGSPAAPKAKRARTGDEGPAGWGAERGGAPPSPAAASTPSAPPLPPELERAYPLSARRFARCVRIRDRTAVDVREWYVKDGLWMPGRRGLLLDRGQWEKLLAAAPAIHADLEGGRGAGFLVAGGGGGGADAGGEDAGPGAVPAAGPGALRAPPLAVSAPDDEVALGPNRRAKVTSFRGRHYVDIRETYEKDGEALPGKKGIMLSVEQASSLAEGAASLGSALRSRDPGLELDLGAKRFASAREFKGRWSVDVREHYADPSGELKPGRKGISLSEDAWSALEVALPALVARARAP